MRKMDGGEAVLRLSGKWDALKKTLRDAERGIDSSMRKIGQGMQMAGRKMALIGGSITAVSGLLVKSGMDAVESENLFEVSMGRMADEARAWSEEMKKSLGVSSYEARKSIGTFNVMLGSMGLSEKAAYGMSKGLTQLSWDMASFYNLKPEEAFMKLQAGISGEAEPLKRLGILINDNAVKAYALEHGIGKVGNATEITRKKVEIANLKYREQIAAVSKSKKTDYEKQLALQRLARQYQLNLEKLKVHKIELDDASKVEARYGLIMERTALAQGDLARTSDSATNRLRAMQAQFSDMTKDIGLKMIPAFTALLERIQPMLAATQTWIEKNPDLATKILLVVASLGAMSLLLAPLVTAIGTLIAAGTALGSVLLAIGAAILGGVIGKGINWLIDRVGFLRKMFDWWYDSIVKVFNKLKAVFGLGGGEPVTALTGAALEEARAAERGRQAAEQAQTQGVLDRLAAQRQAMMPEFQGAYDAAAAQRTLAALKGSFFPARQRPKETKFFASGGVAPGGLAMVGERGPELVNLPRGSRVYSNQQSQQMGAVNVNVSMGGVVVRELADVERISRELGRRMDSRLIARGLRPLTT